MGLLGKGLLGLLLGGRKTSGMPNYLRNVDDSYQIQKGSRWECIYCGHTFQGHGKTRPTARNLGRCSNSPTGLHILREM